MLNHKVIEAWQPVVFVTLLLGLSLIESLAPLFSHENRFKHIRQNLMITAMNSLVHVPLRMLMAEAAIYSDQNSIGLFQRVNLSFFATTVLGLLVLDLSNYGMHRLKHAVPVLWRFHRIHHSDPILDVTSGMRFHPGETVFSILFQLAVVVIFGIPVATLTLYFLILAVAVQLTHANIKYPIRFDSLLRTVFVSPYMHKTHHSRNQIETDSNFADVFSVWDRLFGTYRERASYNDLKLGLEELDEEAGEIIGLMKLPFVSSYYPKRPDGADSVLN